MRRRALLALLASSTAGCVGTPGGSDLTNGTATPTAEPSDGQRDSNTGTSPSKPDPIPFEPAEPISEAACPTDATCYGDAPSTDAVVLAPERTLVPPETNTRFAVANRTAEPFGFNPYDVDFRKYHEGVWKHVTPGPYPEPFEHVGPGDAHVYEFSFSDDYAVDALSPVYWNEGAAIDAFGGGTYAFLTASRAAVFEFDAPSLSLGAPSDATDVTSEGGVLRASIEHDAWGEEGTLTVTTDPDGEESDPLLVEQLLRRPAVHDAVALLQTRDVDAVEITGQISRRSRAAVPAVSFDGTRYGVSFEAAE